VSRTSTTTWRSCMRNEQVERLDVIVGERVVMMSDASTGR
jgi:hypothetical protein